MDFKKYYKQNQISIWQNKKNKKNPLQNQQQS